MVVVVVVVVVPIVSRGYITCAGTVDSTIGNPHHNDG